MALKRVEVIFHAEPGTTEGNELELLASFIEEYEDAQDRELIKQREDSLEIDIDIDDLP